MRENELYVVFDPEFLEDLEELGNSIVLSDYSIEDLREESITDISQVLNSEYQYIYSYGTPVVGYWDPDLREFKTHISLPSNNIIYSNKVTEDGSMLEMDSMSGSIHNGDGLVRVIRFNYTKNLQSKIDYKVEAPKTAFIVTGNIHYRTTGRLVIDPIRCDQDKIIITVSDFPKTTKANIKAATIEEDTEFLEGYGIMRGQNVFKTYSLDTLGTRESAIEYIDYTTSRTKIEKKDVPYIGQDGRGIFRRDNIRVYTGINIYCSNLITSIKPKTRASLNKDGGTLKIYGTLWYTEYEALGKELIYVGEGTEALDGVADSELILTTHNNGLKDVRLDEDNKFYILYGRYEGQYDPSVLVKASVEFWNPFKSHVETIESENLKLTQDDDVIPQWEIIYRSSQYLEPTGGENLPVYVFPWEKGGVHTFTIRTTLPNINIERDFVMMCEDPILKNLFDYKIEKVGNRVYPITDYKVTLTSKTSNLNVINWLPIIDGQSTIKLSTLQLKDYGFSESFYFVQSPKTGAIELHDPNNHNVSEIVLEYNQTSSEYYPIAPEATTESEIGDRDSWEVIDYSKKISFDSVSGTINPNNPKYLNHKLILRATDSSKSILDIDLGRIVLGRIRRSEVGNNFLNVSEWRNVVNMFRISIPVRKRGIIENIRSDSSVILREINLYRIKVTCNGPFACWMSESPDYCFFDPRTNQPTHTNHYYSTTFNSTDGVYVWIALHNTTILNEEPDLVGKIFFTVTAREPDWGEGSEIPSIFSDGSNLATCDIYRQAPSKIALDYVNPKDCYVFLDPYEETTLRFISTETPSIDRLTILNNEISNQFEAYRTNTTYNSITLLDVPTPQFNTSELYRYHTQRIQNPSDLYDYYPISPSCIYRAHSYNYSDVYKEFYIFKKALGPSFYRSDSSKGNVIYMIPDPNNDLGNDKKRILVIRSRYEIHDEEFTTQFDVPSGFEIEAITHTILSTSDYKHQYIVILNTLEVNTGGQRSLGVLIITSRIYNLINFTSQETLEVPYEELTQSDIDAIVPPTVMKIQIIQEAGNGGNTKEIKVIGNRDSNVSNAGETRLYTITSNIPIEFPEITNKLNCDVTGISESGFTFKAQPILYNYKPVVPSSTSSYTTYASGQALGFDLLINPTDSLTYQSYSESFTFRQVGISDGLIFGSPKNAPKLYLGPDSAVSESVSYNITSFSVLLGIFKINNQISEGAKGAVKGINIQTDHTYSILSDTCVYYDENWTPCVRFEFPENNTQKVIDRVFIITYTVSGVTHKIVFTIKQESGSGNVICSDQAYFLSHGECIETYSYNVNNLGFFTFDTDISIKSLSLSFPKSIEAEYNFTYVGTSSLGGSYKTYKAYIKLQPNLSDSTRGNQIFSFIKDGTTTVKNVYINQGFYCLTVCEPGSLDTGIHSGGTLGSESNPIQVPSRSNNYTVGAGGIRKVFKLLLRRAEPVPSTGKYVTTNLDLTSDVVFPSVIKYSWIFTSIKLPKVNPIVEDEEEGDEEPERGSQNQNKNNDQSQEELIKLKLADNSGYLSSYSTELFQSATDISPKYCPFLENIYTVYPDYYSSEIGIMIDADIIVQYPTADPLYMLKKDTIHSYRFYLSKVDETLIL